VQTLLFALLFMENKVLRVRLEAPGLQLRPVIPRLALEGPTFAVRHGEGLLRCFRPSKGPLEFLLQSRALFAQIYELRPDNFSSASYIRCLRARLCAGGHRSVGLGGKLLGLTQTLRENLRVAEGIL
jgi:hypothetical protein